MRHSTFVSGLVILASTVPALASEPGGTAGPLLTLLKSGRLPEERVGTVVELVCQRGGPAELGYVYQQAIREDGYTGELRQNTLDWLADAARTRKVRPEGDLSGIAKLIDPQHPDRRPQTQLTAIRLAGLWKVESAAGNLQSIALNTATKPQQLDATIDALANIGGESGRETIAALTTAERPLPVRYQAVAAMTRFDLAAAAERAADALADTGEDDDPAAMIDAFLERRGGPQQLAASLKQQPPSADVAKRVLRYIYSVGQTDAALGDVLSAAAGITANPEPLTPEDIKQLAVE
ncbi:MAG: hypothetical protein ACREIV_15340, partial [Planctomycetaceae bacterium]